MQYYFFTNLKQNIHGEQLSMSQMKNKWNEQTLHDTTVYSTVIITQIYAHNLAENGLFSIALKRNSNCNLYSVNLIIVI